MLPRPVIVLLMLIAGGLGGWAGYVYFKPVANYVCVGSFPLFVSLFQDAENWGRWSFAVTAGLLAASIPLSALIAARFRKKANYAEAMLLGLMIAVLTGGLGVYYYRHGLQSTLMKTGEFFTIMRHSNREIVFNPLTRALLFATVLTLLGGIVRGLVSPLRGKK
jgi:hypothetical protein